jgi:thiol-disulfide isomerase/thioredoxin
MFVAAILVVSMAGMIGLRISPSRAADDSPTDKPATKAPPGKSIAAKSDPFAVPDGKPPVLMSFIARMRKIKPPKNASDEDKTAFLAKAQSAIVEAAGKILDSKPASGLRVAAVKAKIEALLALKELGDDGANNKLGEMADGLKDDKQAEVARLVKPYVGIAQAEATGKTPKPPRSWVEMKPKLAAAPENLDLAKEAVASVQMLEETGKTDAAVTAYRELGAILAKSKDPQIAAQAHAFDGLVRRLSLPGNPIEISGHLVDGPPINTAALKGKVVLVDFWATWCGPCKAELPNVLANYEKYHSRGFEVVGVSCDQDKAALVKFIADQKLPWPILFQQPGEASMAGYYGITGIPTAILTNKKGDVISLNARGEELTKLLGELLGR